MGGLLPAWSLWVSVAAASPDPSSLWRDLGAPDDGRGPVAVIVPQPGLRPLAYVPLVLHLEAGGLDAGVVALPNSPHKLTQEVLPEVLGSFGDRSVLLVGHGYGGRSALSAPGLTRSPCATALVGVPLVHRDAPWQVDLAKLPPPEGGIPLRRARRTQDPRAPWPLVRTAHGFPTEWLGRLSPSWYTEMVRAGAPVVLPDTPLWVGIAPLDELAPPETLGELPENAVVTRWGMLRGWRRDADSYTILTDPRPAAHLARWTHRTCT